MRTSESGEQRHSRKKLNPLLRGTILFCCFWSTSVEQVSFSVVLRLQCNIFCSHAFIHSSHHIIVCFVAGYSASPLTLLLAVSLPPEVCSMLLSLFLLFIIINYYYDFYSPWAFCQISIWFFELSREKGSWISIRYWKFWFQFVLVIMYFLSTRLSGSWPPSLTRAAPAENAKSPLQNETKTNRKSIFFPL